MGEVLVVGIVRRNERRGERDRDDRDEQCAADNQPAVPEAAPQQRGAAPRRRRIEGCGRGGAHASLIRGSRKALATSAMKVSAT